MTAHDLRIALRTITVGRHGWEALAPERMNGCRITMTRQKWPAGPLFRWNVWERERGGILTPLLTPNEFEVGGPVPMRERGSSGLLIGGREAPLMISLGWSRDDDRDLIRFELEVVRSFRSEISIEWTA